MNRQMQILMSLPKPLVVVLAAGLMLLTGSLDYLTGRDFALAAFYLVPICSACWLAGRRVGVALACAGAAVWLAGEFMLGLTYRHHLTPRRVPKVTVTREGVSLCQKGVTRWPLFLVNSLLAPKRVKTSRGASFEP